MDVPIRFLPTQTIAPETFLIRQLIGEGMAPHPAPLNTMVIRGAEPVIVDTGASVSSQGWMADAVAVHVPGQVDDIRELDPGFFRASFLETQRNLSPWHQWLDADRYQAYLDEFRILGADVVVGAHGVALTGGQVGSAFELLKELPYLPPVPLTSQMDLDLLLTLLPRRCWPPDPDPPLLRRR